MIVECANRNIKEAGKIYAISWYESHKDFCSIEFLEKHTTNYLTKVLEEKINIGWKIFINYKNRLPVGIIWVNYNTGEIGLFYVLPSEFRKGYGLELLNFAFNKIFKYKKPFMIVLNINKRAIKLYEKYGFCYSKEKKILSLEKGVRELKYIYTK